MLSWLTFSTFLLLLLVLVHGLEKPVERTMLTSTERRREMEKIRDQDLFGKHGEPIRRTNPEQRRIESERRAWEDEKKKLSTIYDGGQLIYK